MLTRTLSTALIASAIAVGSAGLAQADPVSDVATPVASPVEDSAALGAFSTYLGAATAVGGFGGTVAGAAIGCAVGGIVTAPTVVFIPAGCISGAVIGAPIGGIIGTIAVGGPTLVIAGVDLANTLTAAPGTTRWAE